MKISILKLKKEYYNSEKKEDDDAFIECELPVNEIINRLEGDYALIPILPPFDDDYFKNLEPIKYFVKIYK